MKNCISLILGLLLVLASGCNKTISPQYNSLNFVSNTELNQIELSINAVDSRSDSARYWFSNKTLFADYKIWEQDSEYFGSQFWAYANAKLDKPSSEIIRLSLSEAFSNRGYNLIQNSPVVLTSNLLQFLYYSDSSHLNLWFAEIKIEISLQNEGRTLISKIYQKSFRSPPSNTLALEYAESTLSACLTDLVQEIVFDSEIENALRQVYGIYIQEEGIITAKPEEIPKQRGLQRPEKPEPSIYTGTGFAVCENGYIATAYHVVDKASSVYVRFYEGDWIPASVIRVSQINDIAILKIDRKTEDFIVLTDRARQGERIFTLGYPVPEFLGEEPKYSEGNVSSLSGIANEASLMQISVPLQPGNSGGPLINQNGEVIGMATSVAGIEHFYKSTGTLPQNVNWGVKSAYIRPLIPELCVRHDLQKETVRIDPIERARNAVCFIRAEQHK